MEEEKEEIEYVVMRVPEWRTALGLDLSGLPCKVIGLDEGGTTPVMQIHSAVLEGTMQAVVGTTFVVDHNTPGCDAVAGATHLVVCKRIFIQPV